ncbi:MAG: DEAD/DEAH box helicase [Flavobacteriaceae bacterium]|nr:DEAD/DEAH box helicase [Flavobacteriaceae bacterium]
MNKSREDLLAKLGIDTLNPMQEEAFKKISSKRDVILLSPTGSGKTVAFLLPLLEALDVDIPHVQLLILAPSRELAIQIEQVIREMGSGFKVTAVYGGRPISKDKAALTQPPAILVGTPGRVADHLRRDQLVTDQLTTIVFDEFDKSLEVGFEAEMREIVEKLSHIKQRILTSATQGIEVPRFVRLQKTEILDYLEGPSSTLSIKKVVAPQKDKLETLVQLLHTIGNEPGIIFCNYKNTIEFLSDHLEQNNIPHGCFYGGLEQQERERALIKFRNGTHRMLIATDLAARGLDIPELNFIIHYQLPLKEEEFTHRNGRTARMNARGTAYVLQWKEEFVPDFISTDEVMPVSTKKTSLESKWTTLFISGGRKDKISKGDIAGLFFKQADLAREELGNIELKRDCAFVAVPKKKVRQIIEKTNNMRLKKKKIRVTLVP